MTTLASNISRYNSHRTTSSQKVDPPKPAPLSQEEEEEEKHAEPAPRPISLSDILDHQRSLLLSRPEYAYSPTYLNREPAALERMLTKHIKCNNHGRTIYDNDKKVLALLD